MIDGTMIGWLSHGFITSSVGLASENSGHITGFTQQQPILNGMNSEYKRCIEVVRIPGYRIHSLPRVLYFVCLPVCLFVGQFVFTPCSTYRPSLIPLYISGLVIPEDSIYIEATRARPQDYYGSCENLDDLAIFKHKKVYPCI